MQREATVAAVVSVVSRVHQQRRALYQVESSALAPGTKRMKFRNSVSEEEVGAGDSHYAAVVRTAAQTGTSRENAWRSSHGPASASFAVCCNRPRAADFLLYTYFSEIMLGIPG